MRETETERQTDRLTKRERQTQRQREGERERESETVQQITAMDYRLLILDCGAFTPVSHS